MSYTQYELLLAQRMGKKVWTFFTADEAPRDRLPTQLDLPGESAVEDAAAFQAERRRLQADYRRYLQQTNQLRHEFADREQLRDKVLVLRDELEKAATRWRRLGAKVNALLFLVIAGAAAAAALLWYRPWLSDDERRAAAAVREMRQEVENISAATERIRESLNPTERETRRALVEGLVSYLRDHPSAWTPISMRCRRACIWR